MPLGKASRDRLLLCPRPLIILFEAVADEVDAGRLAPLVRDTTVACTFRGKDEQDAAFNARPQRSKKPWPESGHNQMPPRAVDFLPYPVDWEAWERDPAPLWLLQGYVRATAECMRIRLKPAIRRDAPHFELAG